VRVQNERPETFNTLTDWLRWRFGALVNQIASWLAMVGLRPNTVTVIGLVFAVGAGWLASQGSFVRAGLVYLAGGTLDAFDGALARVTGRVTRFGAVLDSTLDRYGEGALLAGLGYWLAQNGRLLDLMLVFATLAGSFLVSYVRARAEGLGLELKIGLLTRFERFVIMLLTLFSGQLTIGLAVMAALVNFTVLQRMVKVHKLTRSD
jgi:CDP-diacylglycerol--glycerol-3-phosphate 3-phosphatidyltransferase